jgi:hypothetical protein
LPPPYTEPGQVQINTQPVNSSDMKQSNVAYIPPPNIIPVPPGAGYVTIVPTRMRDTPVQTGCQYCGAR